MSPRRIAAVALSGALLAGGGVAFAAATKDDREQAVIDDAAKRLDVSPQKLRDALSAAREAQIDKAVEDGELTQEQADAIKERIERSGRVLGGVGPRGGPHGDRGPGRHHGARGAIVTDLAKAIGISKDKLREQLRDGKSVAAIAKAEGKSLDGVKSAVRSAAKARADKAVEDGDITRAQADRMLGGLDEAIDHLGERRKGRRAARPRDPDADTKPGAFRPDPRDPAEPQPAAGGVSS